MAKQFKTPPQNFNLQQALADLPDQPGVYQMFGQGGELLYIGKAKVLKHRVRSYFQAGALHTPRIAKMVSEVQWFETILTHTEVEALILEANMIWTYQPRFNVLSRDDKRFPWVAVEDGPFPRIYVTRRPDLIRKQQKRTRQRFYGPFTYSQQLYKTLHLIRKYFPLRQRRKPLFKDRPCMNYHIGLCPGPCQNLISEADYQETLHQVELILKGQTEDLAEILEAQMAEASEQMAFEKAAKIRDQILALETIQQQTVMVPDDQLNADLITMAMEVKEKQVQAVVLVMPVRHGKLLGSQVFPLHFATDLGKETVLSQFLAQHYFQNYSQTESLEANVNNRENLPDELLLPFEPEESTILAEGLSQLKGRRVNLTLPKRGVKWDLLQLAEKNAKEALLKERQYQINQGVDMTSEAFRTDALIALQEALNLPEYPERMECYDISHIQGTQTVASMVVFVAGQPAKSEYRKFNIQSAEGKPDDFLSMEEVMRRRFSAGPNGEEKNWDEPNLVIIDGGKGQLSSAHDTLQKMGILDQPMISLAKRYEEVFFPGESKPVLLPKDSPALFLLQQIRDEAHRFAITAHRSRRAKKATASYLDTIPGIGPTRKAKLLEHFPTQSDFEKATVEDIAICLGIGNTTALKLWRGVRQGT